LNYTDKTALENYLGIAVVNSFESQLEDWISGISRYMDNITNRKLVADVIGSGEDYEERAYDGNGETYLMIDDCQEIISLEIGDVYGENLVATTNYIKFPRYTPHRRIVLKDYGIFTSGIQNVVIKGCFGFFSELPKDIQFACTVLVAGIINSQNKGNDVKKSESIGEYSVTYTDDKGVTDYNRAVEILSSYRKLEF
jgi:hypothetical protein